MNRYEQLRRRHCGEARALVPTLIDQLDWPAERLAAHRREHLRRLLAVARARSPWHRRRLADVDPAAFEAGDLSALPVMTKHDVMEHFDDIVTDRRLTLDRVEAHLAGLTSDGYLLDRYHAVASSGSSGRRGVFVFGWNAWTIRWVSNIRALLRRLEPPGRHDPLVMAIVAAGNPTHGTAALSQTFSSRWLRTVRLPATLPLGTIVAGLNHAQPDVLVGYPSSLGPLAYEARAGRLTIRPEAVASTSEQLLAPVRRALEESWGVSVTDVWSCSEAGGLAASCPSGAGMHLADDLVIVEPADGRVYLTNLYNSTMPLIRYDLGDAVTVLDGPCPCGSGHRRIAGIEGRADDSFRYGHLTVNSLVFESPLARQRHIADYQVRQTRRGAEVSVHCLGPVDLGQIADQLTQNLLRVGLADPEVVIRPVERLNPLRTRTGKLRRFMPLTA